MEAISTGYMLIESGRTSAVEFMSNTKPIPADKPEIAKAHALAAEYMGMKLIYLEAGSGAENPVSDLAFAGIILSNQILGDFFPDEDVFDLGYDLLPRIAGHAAGYVIEDYLLDIGTPEKLDRAERDVKGNKFKTNPLMLKNKA